jgi:hypothetical protein
MTYMFSSKHRITSAPHIRLTYKAANKQLLMGRQSEAMLAMNIATFNLRIDSKTREIKIHRHNSRKYMHMGVTLLHKNIIRKDATNSILIVSLN